MSGVVPLTVPGQAATPPTRVVPARVQDKRGAGRLNMTAAPSGGVTPTDVAQVLELRMEKEAAFIGAGPADEPLEFFTVTRTVVPAVSTGAAQLAPALAGPRIDRRITAAPAMAAPVVTIGPRMGYSVQLAVVGNEAAARAEWQRLLVRIPFQLMGRDAVLDRAMRGDGVAFWRVRTSGFAGYDEARQFCAELKLAGQDCFVTGRGLSAARPAPVVTGAVSPAAQSPEG